MTARIDAAALQAKNGESVKHLVQVVPFYSPPHVGGMEMRARDRAERLAKSGWSVETLTSSVQTYPHTVTDSNLAVRYLKSWEVARTAIIFPLPAALWRIPADSVVQVETAIAYVPEVTALVCRMRGMPYIARVPLDSSGHGRLRDAILSIYQRTVLRWVYKGAAAVIVLTDDDVTLIKEKYHVKSNLVRIIPNATDFLPLTEPRPGFHDPLRLIFAGRVARQKNLPLLLKSMRYSIDNLGLSLHLDLVGDGEDMPTVRETISELNLANNVSLKGYVCGKDLELLYEQADVFVMTSTHESFPQVLLETMAKGLPVVASNIHGVRTVVQDGVTGLLVNLNEISLAGAFYRLITEPGLHRELSSGSLREANRYSWKATMEAYMTLYDELRAARGQARQRGSRR
jgi:glycosyltransferase involved in cell wall biosynthesis